MCLELSNSQMKIATRNIPVYKIISKTGEGWIHSLYINGHFEPWIPGFHYSELDFAKKALLYYGYRCYVIKGNALHSCKTLERAKSKNHSWDEFIVKMYIPRGARYYENNFEYASSSIVYPEDAEIFQFK